MAARIPRTAGAGPAPERRRQEVRACAHPSGSLTYHAAGSRTAGGRPQRAVPPSRPCRSTINVRRAVVASCGFPLRRALTRRKVVLEGARGAPQEPARGGPGHARGDAHYAGSDGSDRDTVICVEALPAHAPYASREACAAADGRRIRSPRLSWLRRTRALRCSMQSHAYKHTSWRAGSDSGLRGHLLRREHGGRRGGRITPRQGEGGAIWENVPSALAHAARSRLQRQYTRNKCSCGLGAGSVSSVTRMTRGASAAGRQQSTSGHGAHPQCGRQRARALSTRFAERALTPSPPRRVPHSRSCRHTTADSRRPCGGFTCQRVPELRRRRPECSHARRWGVDQTRGLGPGQTAPRWFRRPAVERSSRGSARPQRPQQRPPRGLQ